MFGETVDPLRADQTLSCTSCHDPHGSENPSLFYRGFTTKAVCVECHRDSLAPGTYPGESSYELEAEEQRREGKRPDDPYGWSEPAE